MRQTIAIRAVTGLALLGVGLTYGAAAQHPTSALAARQIAADEITPYAATPIATDPPADIIQPVQSTPIATVPPASTIAPVYATPIATVAPAPTIAPYEAKILTPYQATILTPYHAQIITAAPGAKITPFTAPPVTAYASAGAPPLYVASPVGSIPDNGSVPLGLQSVGDATFALQTTVSALEGQYLGWLMLDDGATPSARLDTLSAGQAASSVRGMSPPFGGLSAAVGGATKKVLLYQGEAQVHANQAGHVLAHIPVGFRVLRPVQATVTIIMNTAHGLVSTSKTVTIVPSKQASHPARPIKSHMATVLDSTFTTGKGGAWPVGGSGGTTARVVNGRYVVRVARPGGVIVTPSRGVTLANAAIAAQLQASGDGDTGLVARYSRPAQQAYGCVIRPKNQSFGCYKEVRGRWTALVSRTSPAIKAGGDNQLVLAMNGSALEFWINDQSVARYTDKAPLPAGAWGVMTEASQSAMAASFAEIAIFRPTT